MSTDFVELTEISGTEVSAEQVERIYQRYYWAADYCRGKDVLEVACGTGQGVGYIAGLSKSMSAADYSESILAVARAHYGDRFKFEQFDAQKMPFPDARFDTVIIFEAIYYIPDPLRFFRECKRVLRPGGVLLIATANKDLFDFNPSAHSHRYFGVPEMCAELGKLGYATEFFGGFPLEEVSARQKVMRPVKMIAARLGLIPKSMRAKRFLKKFVFGGLVRMPAEIKADRDPPPPRPAPIPADTADRRHKVLFCAARIPA